ncbi:hypothetical protein ABW19_dt0205088 [Dactylella cylindrospora]|nr:hypothetical protein ABW19_dt0205088 [Dactylella cylindrospora]
MEGEQSASSSSAPPAPTSSQKPDQNSPQESEENSRSERRHQQALQRRRLRTFERINADIQETIKIIQDSPMDEEFRAQALRNLLAEAAEYRKQLLGGDNQEQGQDKEAAPPDQQRQGQGQGQDPR